MSTAAYLGSSLTIKCKYPQNEDGNVRFFCKEDENSACISLISAHAGQITKTDRISLSDHRQQGVYTVNISRLTEDDAGKYWCAMQRIEDSSIACLTEVNLHILSEY